MPKWNVMVGLPTGDGHSRTEVGNFRCEAVRVAHSDPEIKDQIGELIEVPIQRFPTNIARNMLIEVARQHKCDLMFMADSDSWPPEGWFKAAFKFLISQPVPSVVACPYVTGGPNEEVLAFEFTRTQTGTPLTSPPNAFALTRVNRDDAARRKGVERMASLGTHCVAFDMRVIDRIAKPYFAYQFNPEQTAVTETEDCWFFRQLFNVGVPLFVHWDFWSPHYKGRWTQKPMALPLNTVPDFYRQQGLAELLHTPEGRAALLKASEEAKDSDTKPVGLDAQPRTTAAGRAPAASLVSAPPSPPPVTPCADHPGQVAVAQGESPAWERWRQSVAAGPGNGDVERTLATE